MDPCQIECALFQASTMCANSLRQKNHWNESFEDGIRLKTFYTLLRSIKPLNNYSYCKKRQKTLGDSANKALEIRKRKELLMMQLMCASLEPIKEKLQKCENINNNDVVREHVLKECLCTAIEIILKSNEELAARDKRCPIGKFCEKFLNRRGEAASAKQCHERYTKKAVRECLQEMLCKNISELEKQRKTKEKLRKSIALKECYKLCEKDFCRKNEASSADSECRWNNLCVRRNKPGSGDSSCDEYEQICNFLMHERAKQSRTSSKGCQQESRETSCRKPDKTTKPSKRDRSKQCETSSSVASKREPSRDSAKKPREPSTSSGTSLRSSRKDPSKRQDCKPSESTRKSRKDSSNKEQVQLARRDRSQWSKSSNSRNPKDKRNGSKQSESSHSMESERKSRGCFGKKQKQKDCKPAKSENSMRSSSSSSGKAAREPRKQNAKKPKDEYCKASKHDRSSRSGSLARRDRSPWSESSNSKKSKDKRKSSKQSTSSTESERKSRGCFGKKQKQKDSKPAKSENSMRSSSSSSGKSAREPRKQNAKKPKDEYCKASKHDRSRQSGSLARRDRSTDKHNRSKQSISSRSTESERKSGGCFPKKQKQNQNCKPTTLDRSMRSRSSSSTQSERKSRKDASRRQKYETCNCSQYDRSRRRASSRSAQSGKCDCKPTKRGESKITGSAGSARKSSEECKPKKSNRCKLKWLWTRRSMRKAERETSSSCERPLESDTDSERYVQKPNHRKYSRYPSKYDQSACKRTPKSTTESSLRHNVVCECKCDNQVYQLQCNRQAFRSASSSPAPARKCSCKTQHNERPYRPRSRRDKTQEKSMRPLPQSFKYPTSVHETSDISSARYQSCDVSKTRRTERETSYSLVGAWPKESGQRRRKRIRKTNNQVCTCCTCPDSNQTKTSSHVIPGTPVGKQVVACYNLCTTYAMGKKLQPRECPSSTVSNGSTRSEKRRSWFGRRKIAFLNNRKCKNLSETATDRTTSKSSEQRRHCFARPSSSSSKPVKKPTHGIIQKTKPSKSRTSIGAVKPEQPEQFNQRSLDNEKPKKLWSNWCSRRKPTSNKNEQLKPIIRSTHSSPCADDKKRRKYVCFRRRKCISDDASSPLEDQTPLSECCELFEMQAPPSSNQDNKEDLRKALSDKFSTTTQTVANICKETTDTNKCNNFLSSKCNEMCRLQVPCTSTQGNEEVIWKKTSLDNISTLSENNENICKTTNRNYFNKTWSPYKSYKREYCNTDQCEPYITGFSTRCSDFSNDSAVVDCAQDLKSCTSFDELYVDNEQSCFSLCDSKIERQCGGQSEKISIKPSSSDTSCCYVETEEIKSCCRKARSNSVEGNKCRENTDTKSSCICQNSAAISAQEPSAETSDIPEIKTSKGSTDNEHSQLTCDVESTRRPNENEFCEYRTTVSGNVPVRSCCISKNATADQRKCNTNVSFDDHCAPEKAPSGVAANSAQNRNSLNTKIKQNKDNSFPPAKFQCQCQHCKQQKSSGVLSDLSLTSVFRNMLVMLRPDLMPKTMSGKRKRKKRRARQTLGTQPTPRTFNANDCSRLASMETQPPSRIFQDCECSAFNTQSSAWSQPNSMAFNCNDRSSFNAPNSRLRSGTTRLKNLQRKLSAIRIERDIMNDRFQRYNIEDYIKQKRDPSSLRCKRASAERKTKGKQNNLQSDTNPCSCYRPYRVNVLSQDRWAELKKNLKLPKNPKPLPKEFILNPQYLTEDPERVRSRKLKQQKQLEQWRAERKRRNADMQKKSLSQVCYVCKPVQPSFPMSTKDHPNDSCLYECNYCQRDYSRLKKKMPRVHNKGFMIKTSEAGPTISMMDAENEYQGNFNSETPITSRKTSSCCCQCTCAACQQLDIKIQTDNERNFGRVPSYKKNMRRAEHLLKSKGSKCSLCGVNCCPFSKIEKKYDICQYNASSSIRAVRSDPCSKPSGSTNYNENSRPTKPACKCSQVRATLNDNKKHNLKKSASSSPCVCFDTKHKSQHNSYKKERLASQPSTLGKNCLSTSDQTSSNSNGYNFPGECEDPQPHAQGRSCLYLWLPSNLNCNSKENNDQEETACKTACTEGDFIQVMQVLSDQFDETQKNCRQAGGFSNIKSKRKSCTKPQKSPQCSEEHLGAHKETFCCKVKYRGGPEHPRTTKKLPINKADCEDFIIDGWRYPTKNGKKSSAVMLKVRSSGPSKSEEPLLPRKAQNKNQESRVFKREDNPFLRYNYTSKATDPNNKAILRSNRTHVKSKSIQKVST